MKKITVLSVMFFLLSSFAFAGTVDLPRTGQTKCWDTNGVEIPCAGTGQDGEIQSGVAWLEPRFTNNGNGTITDNLTGLVWAQDGNIMRSRDPGWDTDYANDGAVSWLHALNYIEKLNTERYLGYMDWRLPNANELESLINANEKNISIWLGSYGFFNVQYFNYWSSTTYSYYPNEAWMIGMVSGGVGAYYKSSALFPLGYFVWPVRAGKVGYFNNSVISLPKTGQQKCYDENYEIPCKDTRQDGEIQAGVAWPSPRFSASTDCVTDNLTGLMWTRNANLSNGQITWQEALDYVAGINALEPIPTMVTQTGVCLTGRNCTA